MAKMKLPFSLERNNGAAVTGLSELDAKEHLPQSVDATDPTDITETESPINGQEKTDLLSGKWKADMPVSENDGLLLPADGCNYTLGTEGDQNDEGIGISWATFTAGSDFNILLPYAYEEEGETVEPLFPAYKTGELACEQGKTYILFITAILVGMKPVEVSGSVDHYDYQYANLFSLQEITLEVDPETE